MAKYRKLGKTSDQRKALLRNQVTNLLYHGKIVTTEARAKEVKKEIRTAYSNFSYFKNATKEGKDYIINLLKHKYEQFDIYEMPKE